MFITSSSVSSGIDLKDPAKFTPVILHYDFVNILQTTKFPYSFRKASGP